MPLGYHSCPTNPPGIGLSDIRPVPAPMHCLPLLGRLVPHARMLYTSIYHPFFCIMAQVSLGYWRSSLQCCYFHIRTHILGYGAPRTRRPGATGVAGSPRTLILGTRCPTSSRTLILGTRCPKHSHLSYGPLLGSPRTSFSGSCAALKQHDATCHRS